MQQNSDETIKSELAVDMTEVQNDGRIFDCECKEVGCESE
jgi:hypothetical protein